LNVIAIDQEGHTLVMTVNGSQDKVPFDPDSLPVGGGIVVGDGNCWKPNNGKSASQFLTEEELDDILASLAAQGYRAITVATKLARDVQIRSGYAQPDAVIALGEYVVDQVSRNGSFDSGHPVRPDGGDNSFGQRLTVTDDFLYVQNSGGYDSPFIEDIIEIAWATLEHKSQWDKLSKEERRAVLSKKERPGLTEKERAHFKKQLDDMKTSDAQLFSFKKTMPVVDSPRRLAAVACAVYDPFSGQLRTHDGKPWGVSFIVRRVIGLCGAMRGTGPKAPGNPMRAALRYVGKRSGDKVNRAERARTDKLVRELIRAFQAHGAVRPADTEGATLPVYTAQAA
jgi:hypothetical protein